MGPDIADIYGPVHLVVHISDRPPCYIDCGFSSDLAALCRSFEKSMAVLSTASDRTEALRPGDNPARGSLSAVRAVLSRPSRFFRYAASTVLVAAFFTLTVLLQGNGRPEYFFLLLPAIFLAAIFFEHGCGIYAALLSTLLLCALVLPPGTILVPVRFVPALLIFLVTALGLATLSERLKSAFERASAAERIKDLLLQELNHRTKNNLAIVVSMLSIERLSNKNGAARAALEQAMNRVIAIAKAHDSFLPREDELMVEMGEYLTKACAHLAGAVQGIRPITVETHVDEFQLGSKQAIAVGLIVNELVTNAIKHAFPDGRAGTITVTCRRAAPIELIVEDDGVGCDSQDENSGSRLTRLLAHQLGTRISRENTGRGCRVSVGEPP